MPSPSLEKGSFAKVHKLLKLFELIANSENNKAFTVFWLSAGTQIEDYTDVG